MIHLHEINQGERVRVKGYRSGNPSYRRKLLAMGLTPGTEFTLETRAPLGDPVAIRFRGYQLTVRQQEAQQLLLERCT